MSVRDNAQKTDAGMNVNINIVSITPKKRKAKTDAERQKSHYSKRTSEGWKKGWIPPCLLSDVEEMGSIEAVSEQYQTARLELAALKKRYAEKEAQLQAVSEELESSRQKISALWSRGLWARFWNRET